MAASVTSSAERTSELAQLLARSALSDQNAFGELYRRTSAQLYAVALRILRDRGTAEEILQEVYVSVWHNAGSYDAAKSQPLTWLVSIVRNRCLDQIRRRDITTVPLSRDDDEPELEFPSDAPTPVEMLLDAAAAHSVRDCINALEGSQKQAIALAFYHGLTHAELASHLREPLGTVKSWIRRGLERLKRCLDRAGVTA